MNVSAIPLRALVAQLLLGRCEDLDARGVAAFLSGWCTALDVVRRIDLTWPEAPDEVRSALETLLDRIEEARRGALAEPV